MLECSGNGRLDFSVKISSDGVFVISNLTSDKEGTYVCTAKNSLGDAMLSYTVDVGCK